MAISLSAFSVLPLKQQLKLVFVEGTLLIARPWRDQVLALYYLHHFFCELYYDQQVLHVQRTRCFASTYGLEDYIDDISLDDLFGSKR